jgi:hypothetical protein
MSLVEARCGLATRGYSPDARTKVNQPWRFFRTAVFWLYRRHKALKNRRLRQEKALNKACGLQKTGKICGVYARLQHGASPMGYEFLVDI